MAGFERTERGSPCSVRPPPRGHHRFVAATIVDGKLEAYFRAVVLLEQSWIREPKISVQTLIEQVCSMTGENIQVRRFARFHMGLA